MLRDEGKIKTDDNKSKSKPAQSGIIAQDDGSYLSKLEWADSGDNGVKPSGFEGGNNGDGASE